MVEGNGIEKSYRVLKVIQSREKLVLDDKLPAEEVDERFQVWSTEKIRMLALNN